MIKIVEIYSAGLSKYLLKTLWNFFSKPRQCASLLKKNNEVSLAPLLREPVGFCDDAATLVEENIPFPMIIIFLLVIPSSLRLIGCNAGTL